MNSETTLREFLTPLYGLGPQPPIGPPSEEWVLPNQLIGLEVEIEHPAAPLAWRVLEEKRLWHRKNDGSLRAGSELVTTTGYNGQMLTTALSDLKKFYAANEKNISISYRTSIHVHMDEGDLTLQELLRLLAIYISVEGILFDWVGDERSDCIYCVPWQQAAELAERIEELTAGSRILHGWKGCTLIRQEYSKYSALNLARLPDLCTLEFRHLLTTMNMEKIATWINLLMCLKKAAKSWDFSPKSLISELSRMGPGEMLNYIFGDYVHEFTNEEEKHRQLYDGLNIAELAMYRLPDDIKQLRFFNYQSPMLKLLREKASKSSSWIGPKPSTGIRGRIIPPELARARFETAADAHPDPGLVRLVDAEPQGVPERVRQVEARVGAAEVDRTMDELFSEVARRRR